MNFSFSKFQSKHSGLLTSAWLITIDNTYDHYSFTNLLQSSSSIGLATRPWKCSVWSPILPYPQLHLDRQLRPNKKSHFSPATLKIYYHLPHFRLSVLAQMQQQWTITSKYSVHLRTPSQLHPLVLTCKSRKWMGIATNAFNNNNDSK